KATMDADPVTRNQCRLGEKQQDPAREDQAVHLDKRCQRCPAKIAFEIVRRCETDEDSKDDRDRHARVEQAMVSSHGPMYDGCCHGATLRPFRANANHERRLVNECETLFRPRERSDNGIRGWSPNDSSLWAGRARNGGGRCAARSDCCPPIN